MRVGVQRYQTLFVTTERALWRYDVFLFTNQSEVDFGIAHVNFSLADFVVVVVGGVVVLD